MRYYEIVITGVDQGRDRTYSSLANGQNDPGALDVRLDIPLAPYATPVGQAIITIWGVSLKEIAQAGLLNGKEIKVFGGMTKGLPLANQGQRGLLVQGVVQQAFGNWQGTNQTLDMIITAGSVTSSQDSNLTLNWTAGTSLADAIKTTLQTAFPGYTASVLIDPNLKLANDEPGFYSNVAQFAEYVKRISTDVIGTAGYQGVDIILKQNVFSVVDGTTPTTPVTIAFQDLVGQVTWQGPGSVQVECVMRGDLDVGDYVKLPPAEIVTTTAASYSQYRDASVLQGTFRIKSVRHVGHFRQPDGESWMTVYDCYPTAAAA